MKRKRLTKRKSLPLLKTEATELNKKFKGKWGFSKVWVDKDDSIKID